MKPGTAFVIGATGQIGRAAVRALAADGWEVRAASRSGGRDRAWPEDVRTVAVDRGDDAGLAEALGDGCDVLLDCVAYGAAEARQLASVADRVGSAVVVSSGGVYADAAGRSFETLAEPDGDPRYPVPIPESQSRLPADDSTYARGKAALEDALLAQGERLPVTLLRAGAVHGPYSRMPREVYFVKRALDRRPVRVLAYGGRSRFHPVHVGNLAELVRLAARSPGSRVLNAGDPEVPTVAEIGAAVDEVMGYACETVLAEGPPEGNVGATPWSIAHPLVLDMSAAERELGYRAVTGYAESLPATVEWIAGQLQGRTFAEAFGEMVEAYRTDLFDYPAEDRWLAERHGGGR